ncbi:hypothetical protein CapIbe_005913 [Capra ibex]
MQLVCYGAQGQGTRVTVLSGLAFISGSVDFGRSLLLTPSFIPRLVQLWCLPIPHHSVGKHSYEYQVATSHLPILGNRNYTQRSTDLAWPQLEFCSGNQWQCCADS